MLGKMALAFTIGAAISDKHGTAVGKVQADFTKLGATVKSLSSLSKGLDRFGAARDAFLKASAGAHEARLKLAALKAEFDKAPSDRLARQVSRASAAFDAAKIKAFEKRKALVELKAALSDAGVATHKLADEKARLGRELDASRTKLEKFQAVQARRQQLGTAWNDAKGGVAIGAAAAVSYGAAIAQPTMNAARFDDQIRQIAITGEFANTQQEVELGATVRRNAIKFNQSAEEIGKGLQVLVAEGVSAGKAADMSAVLAKGATATRASFEDLAKMTANFDSVLGVKDMELAYSQVAKAGKLGSFEIKDMAKWFPALGGMMKSLGVSGNEAVVSMAARLQIAKTTAGSSDEAANNFKNFLSKITSPDTQKDFDKLGINLQSRMMSAATRGLDPIAAAVDTVMEQMRKASPEAAAAMRALSKEVAAIKDPAERAAELERRRGFIEKLGERAGIGQMFQDMQAVSYLLAEIQGQDKLKEITGKTRSGKSDGGQNVIDEDFALQNQLLTEKLKAAGIAASELGKVVGTALMPVVTVAVEAFTGFATGVSRIAAEFPSLTQAVVVGAALLGGGLVVGKIFLAGKAVFGLVKAIAGLSAAQAALSGGGALARIMSLGSKIGPVMMAAGRSLVAFAPVVAGAVSSAFKMLAFTPWGLAVSALVVAGVLIWKNWDRISAGLSALWGGIKTVAQSVVGAVINAWSAVGAFFGGMWESVKQAFSGGIGNITATLVNWSPLGLLYRAISAGLGTLGVEMPAKLSELGRMMMQGLVRGITNMGGAVKDAIVGVAGSTVQWFKEKLGIKSPSRVFMSLGEMVGQGAAQGIGNMGGTVGRASAALGLAATLAFQPALAAPKLPTVPGLELAAPKLPTVPQGGQAAGDARATRVEHHTYNFTITQQSGENAEALARRIADMLRREQAGQRRAALGDWA